MENLDVRLIVADAKLTYKAIAARMGITRQYLSMCLRYPLKRDMKERIIAAVDDLRGEKNDAV